MFYHYKTSIIDKQKKEQILLVLEVFMKGKSRFISLYGLMGQRERTRFRKFAHSPYHNASTVLCKIIDRIDEYGRKQDVNELGKEALHAIIFPDSPFDYFAMTNYLSDLQALMEQFFVLENEKNGSASQGERLLAALNKRGMRSLFLSKIKAEEKKLGKQRWHDTDWFFQRFRLEELRYDMSVASGGRIGDSAVNDKLYYQELYILASMLESLCEWANFRNVASYQGDDQLDIRARLDYIQARREVIQQHIFLRLYYHILHTLLEPEIEAHFKQFTQVLTQHTSDFPPELLANPYHFAINYCIKKLNKGETAYVRKAFDYYRQAISRNALFHNNELMEGDLKNLVNLGIRLKEFDWTADFLEQYYHYLPLGQQASALAFNRASLHYAKREYSEALGLLRGVDFEDIYYEIGAKTMLLKIYFERMDLEPLEALLTAFRRFLHRNTLVSEYQKTIHNNLIRYTRKGMKLWGLSPSQYSKQKALLLSELEATKEVANIDWLRKVL
jgi:hypothetical protein